MMKMTNAAAASLAPATNAAAARVIFVILLILSIPSCRSPTWPGRDADRATKLGASDERTRTQRDIATRQVATRTGVTENPTGSTGRPVHRMR